MLRISIRFGGRAWRVPFMLDTGADVTILQPRNALLILRDDLFDIDFTNEATTINVGGVGAGSTRCVVAMTRYSFPTDQGRHFAIDAPILIAEPAPFRESREGNWNRPSTLGRDILHRVGFRLDYRVADPVLLEIEP